ncbi:TetR family transcriptional regulator [Mucilaginibacter frigoritolerans]|uniref:TetR family transcriptional regulator n=1 Tax=Mucilaginibacter frigoritolerans TaxID=652788 RepID=A0A562TT83_9SPHI|nr:TetR/AcrR family transcriptional regulator [Mucilaginibacter frigoritolerans]TWI96787.1 TetR family transcriptional regulator [Mucilaginibacter frigoritolerans]
MASKDRILRLKEETRINILEAALNIVKVEGWQALSMRKIADAIEYTAPIIYEYFSNKDAILLELTRKGFIILSKDMRAAKEKHRLPEKQLEAMWLAYWNFAFAEKELYQVMFGVDVNCCLMCEILPEAEEPSLLVNDAIEQLMAPHKPSEDEICTKYYTFWSVVHGLISINMVRRNISDDITHEVLKTAISGIIRSIKE